MEEEAVRDEGGAAVTVTEEELAAVRETLLRAYPETVPELVGGTSVAELLASVEPAGAAFRRVVEAVRVAGGGGTPAAAAPAVPAGNAPPVAVDVERLPAVEKIRRGLARR